MAFWWYIIDATTCKMLTWNGFIMEHYFFLYLLTFTLHIHNGMSDSWWNGSKRTWSRPKVLLWHLTGGTEGNHRNISGQLVSLPRCEPDNSKYNSEAMLMAPTCSVCCSISTVIIYQEIYIIQQVIWENMNYYAPMGIMSVRWRRKKKLACNNWQHSHQQQK